MDPPTGRTAVPSVKRKTIPVLLHEAEAVDDFVDTVVSIFPRVNLHPTLPALQTQTHTELHTEKYACTQYK